MADLDAELLALAGGDESSADDRSPSPKTKSSSPPYHHPNRRSISPSNMPRKGTAKIIQRPRRNRSNSDENGEVSSSSSRHSLQSASMSESASENGTPATGDDKPMFPYDKLYYSSKDKSEIDTLPEIKREEILAERAAQFERHQQDLALRRLLASREKEEAKATEKKKRKAGAADLDETQRKSSRQRTTPGGRRAGERNDAIEAYKKQRAERGVRDERRRRDVADKRELPSNNSPEDDFSDADEAGDNETERRRKLDRESSRASAKDDPIAELVDIQRVKVGRDNFAQVCYNPGFEEAVTDCYARICIGPSTKNPGTNDYRLARIRGFMSGRPYAITAPNGRLMPVETYVIAAHGKAEKAWTFLECSMSRFTEDEWRRYRITMANEDLKLPTKSLISEKLEKINKLIRHRFTDAEITEKIGRQQALAAKVNREGERQPLEQRRQAAIARGDEEEAQRCGEELRDIVPMKLALGTTLVKQETAYVNKEQEGLAELNRRNQRINSENVRKAQVAEMRAKRKHNQRVRGIDDLFADGSDISRAGTPVNNAVTKSLSESARNTPPAHSALAPTAKSSLTPGTAEVDYIEPGTRSGSETRTNGPGSLHTSSSAPFKPVSSKDRRGLPVIKKALLEEEMMKQKVMDLGIDIQI